MGEEMLWVHRCNRCNTEVKYFWQVDRTADPPSVWCKKCMDELDWPSNASETMRPAQSLGKRAVNREIKYHDGAGNRWAPGDPE